MSWQRLQTLIRREARATLRDPFTVTVLPLYIIFRDLGWLDTFKPLIIPAWFGGGAFNIFLMRQFFQTIPRDLDEAARIDGCSTFGIYWRILLPLAKPAVAVVALAPAVAAAARAATLRRIR